MGDGGLVVIDTETTGLGGDARVVELVILADDGRALLHALIDPGCPIPPQATAIHGIADAHVAGRPGLADLWPEVAALLAGRVVVAYNAQFDRRVLAAEAARLGLEWPECDWRCAMRHATAALRTGKAVKLAEACGLLGIAHDERHRALGDARATLALLRALDAA